MKKKLILAGVFGLVLVTISSVPVLAQMAENGLSNNTAGTGIVSSANGFVNNTLKPIVQLCIVALTLFSGVKAVSKVMGGEQDAKKYVIGVIAGLIFWFALPTILSTINAAF